MALGWFISTVSLGTMASMAVGFTVVSKAITSLVEVTITLKSWTINERRVHNCALSIFAQICQLRVHTFKSSIHPQFQCLVNQTGGPSHPVPSPGQWCGHSKHNEAD
jgi:hypothetical protein